jgi:hypothetical protein
MSAQYELPPLRDGSGFIIIGTAGEQLSSRQVVYLDSNGQWQLADADTDKVIMVGMTLQGAFSGREVKILIQGYVGNSAWNFTKGLPVYISTTAGELTQTQPVEPAKVISVGVAREPDLVHFDPSLNTERGNFSVSDGNWDDLRINASSTQAPASNPADWEQIGTSGLYLPRFTDNQDEVLYFEIQLPHDWKRESDILLHVHWVPDTTDAGQVNWIVYYQLVTINGAYNGSASSDSGTDLYDDGDGTQYKHQVTGNHTITTTGIKESAVLVGKIVRLHSGGGDDYNGSPYMASIDLHYQRDKAGTVDPIPA